MPEIGTITTQSGNFKETIPNIPTDESIGGILFDISGFSNPFDNFPYIFESFGNQQVNLVNNMSEVEALGIKDEGQKGFLNGLAYYHLSMFYDYIDGDKPLYIAFADCSKDWDFIITMQRAAGGRMFQLGIWTHQNLWDSNSITNSIGISKMAIEIENAVEEISGKPGQPIASAIPLSIILSANTKVNVGNFTLRKLPDATIYNLPKVSVLLCQDGNDFVHTIQSFMPDKAPVGTLGFAMAILSLAGVEENIGAVKDYNLNKNENFQSPEIAIGNTYFSLDEISLILRNQLTQYGYIVPTSYPSREGECFFGGDPTLSHGDYGIISNNRIVHKCRRVVSSVLLPYLHSDQMYDTANKRLSSITLRMFEEAISSALSGKLINKNGQYQIDGYQINEFNTENNLNDDMVGIKYTISPVNYNGALSETVYVQ